MYSFSPLVNTLVIGSIDMYGTPYYYLATDAVLPFGSLR